MRLDQFRRIGRRFQLFSEGHRVKIQLREHLNAKLCGRTEQDRKQIKKGMILGSCRLAETEYYVRTEHRLRSDPINNAEGLRSGVDGDHAAELRCHDLGCVGYLLANHSVPGCID